MINYISCDNFIKFSVHGLHTNIHKLTPFSHGFRLPQFYFTSQKCTQTFFFGPAKITPSARGGTEGSVRLLLIKNPVRSFSQKGCRGLNYTYPLHSLLKKVTNYKLTNSINIKIQQYPTKRTSHTTKPHLSHSPVIRLYVPLAQETAKRQPHTNRHC